MAGAQSAPTSKNIAEQGHFQQELESMLSSFQLYENKANQAAALIHVPVEYLIAIAQAKYDSIPKSEQHQGVDAELVTRDLFFMELMTWFKTEFFTWVDTPPCPRCAKPTTSIGYSSPTHEESMRSAGRVEIYTCRQCFEDSREVARFPRYNHPAVLLETKKGRCGEWANCFALICRAVGFEIRYVRDWTDHVWVEVFSSGLKQNRWVHADPCENSFDNPLLYETGWGKQLTYVIATSQDDIQDVTWRYTHDKSIRAVMSRRTLCNETWLVTTLIRLRKQKQLPLLDDRKSVLETRLINELSEFLSPRPHSDAKESEKTVRESGSLAWRLARQELGSGASDEMSANFQWEISEENISDSEFCLSYDSAKDQYAIRKSNNSYEHKNGWRNGIFEAQNIFRKEEQDWKMAYLSRKEDLHASNASISWRFKLSNSAYSVTAIKLRVLAAIFHPSASVVIKLTNEVGSTIKILDSNCVDGVFDWNSKDIDSDFIAGTRVLTLKCELQGGHGNQAWQHAQLFRQSLSDLNSLFYDLKPVGLMMTIEVFK